MADPVPNQQPVSVDQIYNSLQQGGATPAAPQGDTQSPGGSLRITIHPKPRDPPPQKQPVSVEEIYKNAGTEPPAEPEPTTTPDEQMLIDRENKRLAYGQFTSPFLKDYKPENKVGEASTGWDDDIVRYKDEKGKLQETDSDNHVVLRDAKDGKYYVYKRSDDTDYGPIYGRILGFGNFLSEGLATTTPVTGGTAPLTVAQRVLQEQRA